MLKAIKISPTLPQAQQLVTFITSLGITQPLELYSCDSQVYINAEIVLPILSVDIKWFLKNSEYPTHYLVVGKNTFINKYGMTKLLGQSKQPAAFKLQDYLYEIFYRIETDGVVNKDSLATRKKLFNMEQNMETYKTIIENNQASIEEARESAKAALNDCNYLEMENIKLNKQILIFEEEIKELNNDLETFRCIASKLAKYVRINSKKPPVEAYSDILDPEENDDERTDNILISDVIKAKDKLKELKVQSKPMIRKPDKPGNIYYLLRSAEFVGDENYSWSLTDIQPELDHINKSEEFLIGELEQSPYKEIVYRTLQLSDDKKKAILLFFELTNGIFDLSTIEKLL